MKQLLLLLLSIQILSASTPKQLNSGESINDAVEKSENKYYTITVPHNKSVHVNLSELNDDVDLYVKRGNEVRLRFNDCYSSNSNTKNEECILTNEDEESEYSILVYGYKASSYTLHTSIEDAEEIPTLTADAINDEVMHKEAKLYKLSGKKGEIVTVTLSDLTADADLRIKVGKKAGLHSFDCKSTNGGTKTDTCSLTLKEDNTVYIQVYGYRSANYSLNATKKDNPLLKLEEILERANQAYQENKNCESDTIVCADKVDNPLNDKLVFVLDREYEFEGSPFTKTTLYAVTRNNYIQQLYGSDSFSQNPSSLIKLNNTDLIAIKIPDQTHIHNYNIDVYNLYKNKVASIAIHRDYGHIALNKIETIDNGSTLVISYWEEIDDVYKIYQDRYDITNTSDVKVISTHEIYN